MSNGTFALTVTDDVVVASIVSDEPVPLRMPAEDVAGVSIGEGFTAMDGSVTSAKLTDNAVITRTIAPGAVTADKIAPGAISASNMTGMTIVTNTQIDSMFA